MAKKHLDTNKKRWQWTKKFEYIYKKVGNFEGI